MSATSTARLGPEQALLESEARLRHAEHHDQLTGLPNRMFLGKQLEQLLKGAVRPRRIAVSYIDLDRFESINDGLGHVVGDRLLLAVADRLRELVAHPGQLLARLDSDKFAILIEETTCPADAVGLASRALAALSEPFQIGSHNLPITASAGVVEGPTKGGEPEEFIRAADIALHWAKADGKARCRLFEYERGAQEVARLRLSTAMPAALARDEFTLHFQPLVDLNNGRLVGFEALARWLHPDRGLLAPDEFISIAEDTGQILALGTVLLHKACRQAATWYGSPDSRPYVSVNLAGAQISDPALFATVVQALDCTALPPNALQLEITEHSVIDTSQHTLAALRALADLGVRITMDDFGTGYSNLASLPMLPLHGLKLDCSFARRLDNHTDTNTRAFLSTVVSLGRSLNLTVTAEGVETYDQAVLMRMLGCHTGQGWLFGKPVPAEQTLQIIRSDAAEAAEAEPSSHQRPRRTNVRRNVRRIGWVPLHARSG